MLYRIQARNDVYPRFVPLSSSQDFAPNNVYIKRISVSPSEKPISNIPLKVANIVNSPLKFTNKALGKIGGGIGTIGGAIMGGVAGSATGTVVSGSMMGFLGGGIGLALGGAIPATLLAGLGLFIGGGSGGITGGIKGFNKGASLGGKLGRNIARCPLNIIQKGVETISNVGIGTPLYVYDKIKPS